MDLRKTKLRATYHDCYVIYEALEELLVDIGRSSDPARREREKDVKDIMRRVSDAVRDNPDE